MSNFWKDYPKIEKELLAVKQFMLETVNEADDVISEPLREVIGAGGKMLRPALVILGAQFGTYSSERIVPIAASVELLHTATLIHDDIIDEATIRRGIATIQSKYSKQVAVLIGDYVFAKTFDILAGDYPPEMLKQLSGSVVKIAEGELNQFANRYNPNISYEKYIEIIAGKTAALFSMSLFAGAFEAEVSQTVLQRLVKIGYCMGMMFQIVDDCLDYSEDTASLGKSTVNDIKQGYVTLPLFFALQNDDDNTLHQLVFESKLTQADITHIKTAVLKNGGLDKAKQKVQAYADDAEKALKMLKKSKQKQVLNYMLVAFKSRKK